MAKPTTVMSETTQIAVNVANRFVSELDKRNVSVYVSLAKAALWLVAVLMVVIIVNEISYGRLARVDHVIGASQVLTLVAVTVLGWHGYKGSRVLHILRHIMGDE